MFDSRKLRFVTLRVRSITPYMKDDEKRNNMVEFGGKKLKTVDRC